MGNEIIDRLRGNPGSYHPGWGGLEYTSWQDEQMSWKSTCYLGDWSFLWDVEISGPDALAAFRTLSVNSYEKFAIGQAKHVVMCNDDGKVITEGVLMRLDEEHFATQSASAMYLAYRVEHGTWDATWNHRRTFQFQVSGPTALATCQKVTGEDLTDIRFMHFREVSIGGARVLALRQGMAGEVGFEFHGDAADAETVRAAILEAGAEFGIRRLGSRTAMINHLEAAFPTGGWHYLGAQVPGYVEWTAKHFDRYGLTGALRGSLDSDDLNDYLQSPVALGWVRSIRFDHDFVGRAALEKEVADPTRLRCTLEWDPEDVVDIYASLFSEGRAYDYLDIPTPQRWGVWADAVEDADGNLIGTSSVPGYSYYFRKVLSLAYLTPLSAQPGTRVLIRWGSPGTPQKMVCATVAPAPYKQDMRRSDLRGPGEGGGRSSGSRHALG